MRVIYQLISINDGRRSEAMASELHRLPGVLRDCIIDERRDDYGVIVLMEEISDGEMRYSQCPFMLVSSFVELDFSQPEVNNHVS